MNGRDLTGISRRCYVVDFFGCTETAAKKLHPEAYQWILNRVKPERDQNRRESIRKIWWRFGWEPVFRRAIVGLERFVATPETAKHRFFVFLSVDVLPDNMLSNVSSDDAFHLGVLSSRVHVSWALSVGGTPRGPTTVHKATLLRSVPLSVLRHASCGRDNSRTRRAARLRIAKGNRRFIPT